MDEGLCNIYLEKVKESDRPAMVISEFYNKVYGTSIDSKLISTFQKLVNMYGRVSVFIAILDTFDVNDFRPDSPYPLLVFFIKKRLLSDTTVHTHIDTDSLEKRLEKISNRKRKLKFGDPFKDEFGNNSDEELWIND
jgi:hypothetical protein